MLTNNCIVNTSDFAMKDLRKNMKSNKYKCLYAGNSGTVRKSQQIKIRDWPAAWN